MRTMLTAFATLTMAIATTAGTPAMAKEKLANAAIMAGDYATAERILIDQPRTYRELPEMMLNLAFVYAQTGRQAEASALYRDVLKQPDVDLDNSVGTFLSSHEMAKIGLSRLSLASR